MSTSDQRRFYGKYRGKVVNNVDPQRMGRLLVQVPDVLGDSSCMWALPASPLAGQDMGIYVVPPTNSGVWVEFEQGDPNDPVWVGGMRGSNSDMPRDASSAPPSNPPIAIQSEAGNQIIISSTPGEGIKLAVKDGPSIELTKTGIKLVMGNASIELTSAEVKINGDALVVR